MSVSISTKISKPSSGVNSNSLVIEVGPGGGVMTRELASRAKNVLAYEIDIHQNIRLCDDTSEQL